MTEAQFARFRAVMHRKTLEEASLEHARCPCRAIATCPMLRDEIWKKIAYGERFLCWPCAEGRLGREIRLDDLGTCFQRLVARKDSREQNQERD